VVGQWKFESPSGLTPSRKTASSSRLQAGAIHAWWKFGVEIPLNNDGHRHPHLNAKSEEEEAMAKPRMDFTSFVGKLLEQDDIDALREGVRILAQAVMETEVSDACRTESRGTPALSGHPVVRVDPERPSRKR
jgi:hypothetical protein